MNSKLLAGAAAAAFGLGLASYATLANAYTLAWSYTGLNGYDVSASGTLNATPLGGGVYAVNSIGGTYASATSGVSGPVSGPTTYAGEDNEVYTTFPNLDYPGLAFLVNGVSAFNVYYDTDTDPTTDSYSCGAVGYCEIGPGVAGTSGLDGPDPIHQIAFTLSAVPEPSAWAMMLVGFGGLGMALRGARRRATAIA